MSTKFTSLSNPSKPSASQHYIPQLDIQWELPFTAELSASLVFSPGIWKKYSSLKGRVPK